MKRSNRLVILVGVLLAVLAFVAIVILLNNPNNGGTGGTEATPTTVDVLVATQDIAIDAWRIESAPPEMRHATSPPGSISPKRRICASIRSRTSTWPLCPR